MTKATQRRLGLFVLAAAMAASAAAARDESCEITGAERVVAIGDVHGAYPEFLAVLRMAGLVDEKGHWTGGRTHLVQTGDILDRGSGTKQVMDLLMKLEGQAKKAGGRVHALLGNHEAMNLLGDLRYVSREEYKAFEELRSREEAEILRTHAIRPGDLVIGGNHAFCTTRMHGDPAQGVVDELGRCHDFDNLYLADSGVFPECPSVNPMWTVMALARRTALAIRDAH